MLIYSSITVEWFKVTEWLLLSFSPSFGPSFGPSIFPTFFPAFFPAFHLFLSRFLFLYLSGRMISISFTLIFLLVVETAEFKIFYVESVNCIYESHNQNWSEFNTCWLYLERIRNSIELHWLVVSFIVINSGVEVNQFF